MRAAVILVFSLVACTPPGAGKEDAGPAASAVHLRFDPTFTHAPDYLSTWTAFPFPADFRRTDAGTIRTADFPDPDYNDTLGMFTSYAEKALDGFSTNGAVHLAFDAPLDTTVIPTDAAALAAATSPIQLVDVTGGSPEYGTRRPLRWQYFAQQGKFVAADSLAVGPAWGWPLRERTTYALVLTDALRGARGEPVEAPALLGQLLSSTTTAADLPAEIPAELRARLLDTFAPLRAWVGSGGLEAPRIVGATVFTTQDITGALHAIRAQVRGELPVPSPSTDGWVEKGGPGLFALRKTFRPFSDSLQTFAYDVYEGRFPSPNYQEGEPPYPAGQGALHFVDGAPRVVRTEALRFVLSVPASPPRSGTCYPIVEVSHGTGGDAYSAVDDGTAGRLAARGLATLGLDQPMQGIRGTLDPASLALNPSLARGLVRQSAVDVFSTTVMLENDRLDVPADRSNTGERICFRGSQPLFYGHSQGGLTGSVAAAFETTITSWMLSGAGGGAAVTGLYPGSVNNQEAVIRLVLEMHEGDEPLTDLHPVMTLVQSLVDVTDTINYAPGWARADGAPSDIMLTSGMEDVYTPWPTANALARAAGLPVVKPLAEPIAGMEQVDAPVVGNRNGATRGFLQWHGSHFTVYEIPEAIHASIRFLEARAWDGAAVIERDVFATDL